MRAAVYGAGALGTVLGAWLTRAGTPVDLISRSKDHVDALNRTGAVITGLVDWTVPVTALTPEEMQGAYDLIFLLTKQIDNAAEARRLQPHLAENGAVCVLQNGIPEPELAQLLGEDHVIGGVITWNAVRKGPGAAWIAPPESSVTFGLGTLSGRQTPQLLQAKALLEQMGPVTVVENLPGLRWSKLLINASLSCPATIMGGRCGDVTADPAWRRIELHILRECVASGRAVQGHDYAAELAFSTPEQEQALLARMPELFALNAPAVPSMLPDLQKGRPCEIDGLNGVVCRTGRQYGVPTPFNDLAV